MVTVIASESFRVNVQKLANSSLDKTIKSDKLYAISSFSQNIPHPYRIVCFIFFLIANNPEKRIRREYIQQSCLAMAPCMRHLHRISQFFFFPFLFLSSLFTRYSFIHSILLILLVLAIITKWLTWRVKNLRWWASELTMMVRSKEERRAKVAGTHVIQTENFNRWASLTPVADAIPWASKSCYIWYSARLPRCGIRNASR